MPVAPTYPGVYVQELPSPVHNIVGATTSVAAFVDSFSQGPLNTPTQVSTFGEFQSTFGGLVQSSESSYGLLQFFANGGGTAWVVRISGGSPATTACTFDDSSAKTTLTVSASSPGSWGNTLQVAIDTISAPSGSFNLVIRQVDSSTAPTTVVDSEIYRNLNMTQNNRNYAPSVINAVSALIQVTDLQPGTSNILKGTATAALTSAAIQNLSTVGFIALQTGPSGNPGTVGTDGSAPDLNAYNTGIATLSRLDPYSFNLLCLPGTALLSQSNAASVYATAAQLCVDERAFLLVDPPTSVTTPNQVVTWVNALSIGVNGGNAAVYYPRLQVADPINQGRLRNVAPSGTMAGVYATTDANRGVWKAPAGITASLNNSSVASILNDTDSAQLNPLGIDVLRNFSTYGNVSWGARTMQGADQIGSQWAYIPVRRTALYLEQSLLDGLKWAVFEPNDEPLWSQIRLNVTSFLHQMFRQGAFQGTSATSAYFVKCDSETTQQADIDAGIVNIVVGFAPLKPAEFIILQIEQLAGAVSS